ncbi:MAG: PLP-dependent transferase, partial [Pseudomonadota bacterium]
MSDSDPMSPDVPRPDLPVDDWEAETRAVQALGRIDPATRGAVPSIDVSTTYVAPHGGGAMTFGYGRPDNATVRHAEDVVANLEGAACALAFSSGMAAAVSAFLALERP